MIYRVMCTCMDRTFVVDHRTAHTHTHTHQQVKRERDNLSMQVPGTPLTGECELLDYLETQYVTVGPVFIARLNYCVRRFAEAFANLIVAIDLQIRSL